MQHFSKLPTWWIRDPDIGLKVFVGGKQAGESIAGLKVLIALSNLMNFNTCKAKNSFSDLEKLTGLSRPMVQKGILMLEAKQIVRVDRTGHMNEYELVSASASNASNSGWAKLPYDRVRKHLSELSNRGVVPLTALKIYLLLASMRPNTSQSLAIAHGKIRDTTGVQKKHIRPGLDILYSHMFIRLSYSENDGDDESPKARHNVYTLQGIHMS